MNQLELLTPADASVPAPTHAPTLTPAAGVSRSPRPASSSQGTMAPSPPVQPDAFISTIPTATAHQARLQLYQPTRRPKHMERVISGPWGTATVRGKIGQVHADIVEAICRHAEDHRIVPLTGHLQILVDPYKVRVSVGGGSAYSRDTLWNMLRELRETSIVLEVPSQRLKVLGGILDRVEESSATRLNPLTREERPLWRVTFDPAFAIMLRDDLHLYYDPAPLARIDSGVAQAIARHILTHRNMPTGGWMLDTLIQAVGAGTDAASIRNRRREVRNCKDQLAVLGIHVTGDRLLVCDDAPEI